MKIQAAVLRTTLGPASDNAATLGEPFSIESLDLDDPREGEVLLKMAAAGVCHSDWHVVRGDTRHDLPVVLGHEGAGVVLGVGGGVDDVQPGDHVAINWSPSCGQCFYCLGGQPYLCSVYVEKIWSGMQLDGTSRLSRDGETILQFHAVACFADHMVVPKQCVVPVDRELPLGVAALVGCAATTGVGAVFNTAQVTEGSTVAIFGAGGVGLCMVMAAGLAGAGEIIVIDQRPEKLAMAESFGATATYLASDDPIERIRRHTAGRGADFVFEAVGAPAVQETCFTAARPGGKVVLAGLSPMGSGTNFPGSLITRQEKSIHGCYYGSCDVRRDFARFGRWYQEGRLDLDRLITRTYPLDQINAAYGDLLAGRLARGLIVFE